MKMIDFWGTLVIVAVIGAFLFAVVALVIALIKKKKVLGIVAACVLGVTLIAIIVSIVGALRGASNFLKGLSKIGANRPTPVPTAAPADYNELKDITEGKEIRVIEEYTSNLRNGRAPQVECIIRDDSILKQGDRICLKKAESNDVKDGFTFSAVGSGETLILWKPLRGSSSVRIFHVVVGEDNTVKIDNTIDVNEIYEQKTPEDARYSSKSPFYQFIAEEYGFEAEQVMKLFE